MRFMMIVKGDKNYESGIPPSPELMAVIGKHTEEMMKAGVVLQNGGLLPSSQGAKVRAADGKVSVTDGPFTEAKELIGGFAIVEAKSKAEAIERATEFMQLHVKVLGTAYEGECEIRQMFDPADCVTGKRWQ